MHMPCTQSAGWVQRRREAERQAHCSTRIISLRSAVPSAHATRPSSKQSQQRANWRRARGPCPPGALRRRRLRRRLALHAKLQLHAARPRLQQRQQRALHHAARPHARHTGRRHAERGQRQALPQRQRRVAAGRRRPRMLTRGSSVAHGRFAGSLLAEGLLHCACMAVGPELRDRNDSVQQGCAEVAKRASAARRQQHAGRRAACHACCHACTTANTAACSVNAGTGATTAAYTIRYAIR